MAISYNDIYGREYHQEFTFGMQYDLDKESERELILKTRDITIEHHIGESPYMPKEGS